MFYPKKTWPTQTRQFNNPNISDAGNTVSSYIKLWRGSEIMWNDNLIQQGNFNNIFLARHVSNTYAHHQEH